MSKKAAEHRALIYDQLFDGCSVELASATRFRSLPATWPLAALTRCTRLQAVHVTVSYVLLSLGAGAWTRPCTLCPVIGHRYRKAKVDMSTPTTPQSAIRFTSAAVSQYV